jgi:lysophospholipase L1-like esterase
VWDVGDSARIGKKMADDLAGTGVHVLRVSEAVPEMLTNYASFVIPNDGHPNEEGNRRMAEALIRHWQENLRKE